MLFGMFYWLKNHIKNTFLCKTTILKPKWLPVFKKRCKGKWKLTIYLYNICSDKPLYCIFTFRMLRANFLLAIAGIFCCISCTTQVLPTNNLPKPDHIVVLIFENHDYQMIIDTSTPSSATQKPPILPKAQHLVTRVSRIISCFFRAIIKAW